MQLICPLMVLLLFIPHYPHNLINEDILDLIERAFKQFYKNECTLYLAYIDKKAFFISTDHKRYKR